MLVFLPNQTRPISLLQGKRAKRGGLVFLAVIPPVPSVSGGRIGDGDGDGPRNRRAAVNRLDSIVSRSSFTSPALLRVEERAPGVAMRPLCRRIRLPAAVLVGGLMFLLLQDGYGACGGDGDGARSAPASSWRLGFCLFAVWSSLRKGGDRISLRGGSLPGC